MLEEVAELQAAMVLQMLLAAARAMLQAVLLQAVVGLLVEGVLQAAARAMLQAALLQAVVVLLAEGVLQAAEVLLMAGVLRAAGVLLVAGLLRAAGVLQVAVMFLGTVPHHERLPLAALFACQLLTNVALHSSSA